MELRIEPVRGESGWDSRIKELERRTGEGSRILREKVVPLIIEGNVRRFKGQSKASTAQWKADHGFETTRGVMTGETRRELTTPAGIKRLTDDELQFGSDSKVGVSHTSRKTGQTSHYELWSKAFLLEHGTKSHVEINRETGQAWEHPGQKKQVVVRPTPTTRRRIADVFRDEMWGTLDARPARGAIR